MTDILQETLPIAGRDNASQASILPHSPPTSDGPALRVENLSVFRSRRQILHDITFSILPGEVLGVIGPNGAGKSSLLMALCGQIKPTAGVITCGRHQDDTTSVMAFGYAPQRSALYDRLTASENVAVFARFAGVKRHDIQRNVANALEKVEAIDIGDKRAGQLSGGQRQRINIACALVGAPSVLALDEPASSLDPSSTRALGDLVRRLSQAGQAILIVTHDMDEAERICDRIIILNDGNLVANDRPRALISRYTAAQIDTALEFASQPASPGEVTHLHDAGFRMDACGVWRGVASSSAHAFQQLEAVEQRPDMPEISHVALSKPGLGDVINAVATGWKGDSTTCV